MNEIFLQREDGLKRMRKRKDSGFTLIELMIVIAVIGILAIVLIPKVGTVKTQAKATGLDTNIRLVQGYAESKIDKWVSKKTPLSGIATDIQKAFSGNDNKNMVNPFTSETLAAVEGTATISNASNYSLYVVKEDTGTPSATSPGTITDSTNLEGSILVVIDDSDAAAPVEGIYIYAYDQSGQIIPEKTVHVTP